MLRSGAGRTLLVVERRLSSSTEYATTLLPKGARAFIDGEWTHAKSKKTFNVTNPFNSRLLAKTSNCQVADAEAAVAAARKAYVKWSLETTAKQRGAILHRWFQVYSAREAELAELLTLEQGKPLAESRGEIQYSASFFDWYAGEARRIYGQVVSPPVLNRQHLHTREPIGVVALITPWNFPSAMIARKTGAALAAGCTLVVKPAEDTPLSALALAQTAAEAGVPPGVFNVIPADRENTATISEYLCDTPDVDAISFTGSTAVGKLLLSQSANSVKRVCVELGGNAPCIIFPSANLEKAAAATLVMKSRCSGQTCVSPNRFFVHESIHDQYLDILKKKLKDLVVGDGMKKEVTQGPLINDKAVHKIDALIADAKKKGAKVTLGGGRVEGAGSCYQPTIVEGVDTTMDIAHNEIFGPVVAVSKFKTEEEVLKRANNHRSGLAGYFFSQDPAQIFRVQRQLHVGMVGVNEGAISCAEAAFGGVKESGLGREGAAQGIDEYTQWKYICQSF